MLPHGLFKIGLVLATLPSASAPALTLTSQELPLWVDYSDASQAGLAAVVLEAAEGAWQRLVLDLGYPAPFTRDSAGTPVTGMSLVIASTGMGAGGAMARWGDDVPGTANCDCSGSIVIDRATAPTLGAVAEGVFHEFHHTLEYAVDCTEAPSAYEGFTIAAVFHEFPESTIVPWVISQFQAFPEYPLDYWTMTFPCDGRVPCFPYQLGAALFPLYLIDRFGQGDPRTLRDIFGRFSQTGTTTVGAPHPSCSQPNHPHWIEGVDQFLREHGSDLEQAFSEFSAWRAIVGKHDDHAHFQRGSEVAEPAIALTQPLSPDAGASLAVHAYGSRYLEFTSLRDAGSGPWLLRISADPEARWSSSVLRWRGSEPVERRVLPFQDAQAQACLDDPAGLTRLVLVVSQHGASTYNPDDMAYDSEKQFSLQWEQDTLGVCSGSEEGADAGSDGGAGDAGLPQDESQVSGGGCACGAGAGAPVGSGLSGWLGVLGVSGLRRRAVGRVVEPRHRG